MASSGSKAVLALLAAAPWVTGCVGEATNVGAPGRDDLADAGTPGPVLDAGEPDAGPGQPDAGSCGNGLFAPLDGGACTPWTDCQAGTFIERAGSASSDRRCAPCPPGTFSRSTNAQACEAWAPCAPGEFVVSDGSSQLDRSCRACPTGTFSVGPNAATCTPWTECPAGTSASLATSSLDRACQPCAAGTFAQTPNAPQCLPWASCQPGSFVEREGSATADRTCSACASGLFSSTTNATVCTGWTSCAPGSFVDAAGSASSDRRCAACAAGSFSTAPNQATCAPWSRCAPGQFVSTTGTASRDQQCAVCPGGTFSDTIDATMCRAWADCQAGSFVSAEPRVDADRRCQACPASTFSAGLNALVCAPWATCAPGTFVSMAGTATSNRSCSACPAGTFSTQSNVSACTPWRVCMLGETEVRPGSSTTNRECLGPFVQQFGTSSFDEARAVAADGTGGFIVVGTTIGTFPGQPQSQGTDSFVRRYDASGGVVWTRMVSSSGADIARAVVVDATGIVIVGSTSGTLQSGASGINDECFVQRRDLDGNVLWTRQFGTVGDDRATSVATRGGLILVGGFVGGPLPSEAFAGGNDGFVRLYDAAGNDVWTRVVGTSGFDGVAGVGFDGSGSIRVAGSVGGALPGQSWSGSVDTFLRAYQASGVELWTRQFGSTGTVSAIGVVVEAGGAAAVAGTVDGVLAGQTRVGASDAFIRKYDASGIELWTRQFGSTSFETSFGVALDPSNAIIVVGETRGTFAGQSSSGSEDVFVRRYSASGTETYTLQFGSTTLDSAYGVAADTFGIVVVGQTLGALPGQVFAGSTDAFVRRIIP